MMRLTELSSPASAPPRPCASERDKLRYNPGHNNDPSNRIHEVQEFALQQKHEPQAQRPPVVGEDGERQAPGSSRRPGNKPRPNRRPPLVVEPDTLLVRGAHQHNLRHIDVAIPRNKLVVLTGVSGSGKSSLAFDTIYAEGQRRYVESLSSFARQYVEQVEKPKVDYVTGLSPTIAIEQKTISRNPRSTVGTITEIISYLRLLFSRIGTPHCTGCGQPAENVFLSNQHACKGCGSALPPLMAAHFSPNTPYGMCPDCNGLGTRLEIDPNLIVDQPQLSLLDGASRWYGNIRKNKRSKAWLGDLHGVAEHYGADLELPWLELPQQFRDVILYGSGDQKIRFTRQDESEEGSWTAESEHTIKGVIYHINRLFKQTKSNGTRHFYASFMSQLPCPSCEGTRLCAAARAVTLGSKTITEVGRLAIDQTLAWVAGLSDSLPEEQLAIGGEALAKVEDLLQFMIDVGLHYLALDRPAPTLSGGEGQRLRLASQLGSELVGVMYVLDEPSIGLHARDQRTLIDTLLHLRNQGNSVLVVEHDEATIRSADWLIELGPGAGRLGGQVIAQGPPDLLARDPRSLTGRYLSGALSVTAPNSQTRRVPDDRRLSIVGARLHNLKRIDAHFPLGVLTCVTGVSGSGKSSLIAGTLYPALQRALHLAQAVPGPHDRITGLEHLDKVIVIDQSPIGRTPRSNPATYIGVFDDIRRIFAGTPGAKARGFNPDRFSFNAASGRCEACQGHGQKKIEMHFLADVWITCKECGGLRFNAETLAIHYQGKSIAEVLDLEVAEALDFFAGYPKIVRILQMLHDVGLDYIKLGQSAMTFSGGEAQRIKLASELSRVATGRTLYILDEPTTGLHFADIQRLLDVLHRLVDAGNTMIVIEHNLDVIKTADWIIDLGPEGGEAGGTIVAAGPPTAVAEVAASYTGQALRAALAGMQPDPEKGGV